MGPTHTRKRIKSLSHEIRDVTEREHVVFALSYQVLSGCLCELWVLLRVSHLEVAIEYKEG